jgi:hypothetical protein
MVAWVLFYVFLVGGIVFTATHFDTSNTGPEVYQRIVCTTDELVRFNDLTMTLECVTVHDLLED